MIKLSNHPENQPNLEDILSLSQDSQIKFDLQFILTRHDTAALF